MKISVFVSWCLFTSVCIGQTLESELLSENTERIAAEARATGDARRGAILFHQVHTGCVKCHAVDGSSNSLGPDLTRLGEQKAADDAYVVDSVLKPSAVMRKGFEPITILTTAGKTHTGLLVERNDRHIIIRDPARNGERMKFQAAEMEEAVPAKQSIMPAGTANQLSNRKQFLDLIRYLLELRDGGLAAARKLQPPPGLIAFKLPEYEKHVDHVGLIQSLDQAAFDRGEAIYNRLCINCHGNRERPGSLPTAMRFAEGKFRSKGDPYSMYRTLTHGFGLMMPQTWMVPQQKYDVVHYIREAYIRRPNPDQYFAVTKDYLKSLPAGDTFGPEPVDYAPWSDMNYGPSMVNTFEVGSDGSNIAYKGIAVRLDAGPGGVSRGNKWAIFDHDTMRLAAAWTRSPDSQDAGFINWQGIHFDGRHGAHPRIAGDVRIANPTGPGWARPGHVSFNDSERVKGRDGRNYGPLPREWAQYRGLHATGDRTIIEYSVGDMPVLESPGAFDVALDDGTLPVFTRSMHLGPRLTHRTMSVATLSESRVVLESVDENVAVLKPFRREASSVSVSRFQGGSRLTISDADRLDMTGHDFTITARIRTDSGGTIFCKAPEEGPWIPNGTTFFVRGGRLTYDIGWVGAAQSTKRVNDGQWHHVAMSWSSDLGEVSFYIDGRKSGSGNLKPKDSVDRTVARIGFTSDNFPAQSGFEGDIETVAFYRDELTAAQIQQLHAGEAQSLSEQTAGCWDLTQLVDADDRVVNDTSGNNQPAVFSFGVRSPSKAILAGVAGTSGSFRLLPVENRMCVQFSTRVDALQAVVWTASVEADMSAEELKNLSDRIQDHIQVEDLSATLQQSPAARWPEITTTVPIPGPDDGPFVIDQLTTPVANPWFARIRLTGHDFLPDGNRVAVCSWDGDVWMVSGLKSLDDPAEASALKWQRIASGLFQPLGLKVVDQVVYVTCRDQLVILRDRNGDGETDFYECFNNDHQVTEHFHEFAMGLQRDDDGNLYYAKSARHALKAVVPHHGTLLRISPDGSRTDILARGFRAANGVCLNPDGSFIVTDQEGHWNPKNRINWVREGGFYGNMFGYHDITDESDSAMEQPLCWITNAFDRSPAELMWINNDAWGPLNGSLLNLSYGYGKVYVVPHENINGQMQGGMCEFPIPQFPTGTARGRISPHDNGLYLSGMFAWGSSQQTQEGGFYRVRYTGRPSNLPVGLQAREKQLRIRFSDPLDPESVNDPGNYSIKVWSLQRTANYGSKHYDEHPLEVTAASLDPDGRTAVVTVPQLVPTWCMEIRCRLRTSDGDEFERVIHNTIHELLP